jgi:hypothetical protein
MSFIFRQKSLKCPCLKSQLAKFHFGFYLIVFIDNKEVGRDIIIPYFWMTGLNKDILHPLITITLDYSKT